MKTLNLICLIAVILLSTISNIYSQSDSGLIYFPNDVSIYYNNGTFISTNMTTGKKTIVPDLITFNDINKIKFLNDSMMNVSNSQQSDIMLNINKINAINIKSGSNTGLGIALGGLLGLVVGGLAGAAIGTTFNTSESGLGTLGTGIGGMIGGTIGLITGGVTGGIIGNNTKSYETYGLQGFKSNKKKEFERILLMDRKLKSE